MASDLTITERVVRRTKQLTSFPSGWWILPSVLFGIILWIFIIRWLFLVL